MRPYPFVAGVLALPATLLRLLDSALSPRLAMWRSEGDDEERTPVIFDALSAARAEVLRMQEALEHDATRLNAEVFEEAPGGVSFGCLCRQQRRRAAGKNDALCH